MPRDSQRTRVYKAEAVLRAFPGTDVSTPEKYSKRAAEITGSLWMKSHYPDVHNSPPRLVFSVRRTGAMAWAFEIHTSTSSWAMQEFIYLHELAHAIRSRQPGDYKTQPHGWEFCEVYLSLVSRFMGTAHADALKASFKKHRVRFSKPRTRTLTDEQRAALRDRLAAVRAQRTPMTLIERISTAPRRYVTTELRYGWARIWLDGDRFVAEHLAGNRQAPYAEGLFKFGDEAGLRMHLATYGGAL